MSYLFSRKEDQERFGEGTDGAPLADWWSSLGGVPLVVLVWWCSFDWWWLERRHRGVDRTTEDVFPVCVDFLSMNDWQRVNIWVIL